jgi:U3 small nucleolar RNA-associated protein 25
LVFGGFVTPEIMKLFNHNMLNVAGKVKTQAEYIGSMIDLGVQVRQIFTRIDPPTPAADPDTRFDYFTKAILPSLLRNTSTSTLIFIPSYFDFVRMRNYLSNAPIPIGAISEETPVSSVARARSHFFTGRHSVLLYSERAHHFRRYDIRGVTSVVFYGLPDNPLFYREVAGGFIGRSVGEGRAKEQPKVRVIFSRWDAMKLERIVGSKRVRVMCMDKGDTFEFV